MRVTLHRLDPPSGLSFNYVHLTAFDLEFWYGNGPGSPVGAAMGAGYANELLDRLLHIQPSSNPFSVNATLDGSNTTFPLDQAIYVDATHDVSFPLFGEVGFRTG